MSTYVEDPWTCPVRAIRLAAAAWNEALNVQAQAAVLRTQPLDGSPMTVAALFKAEKSDQVHLETVLGWTDAWGVEVWFEMRHEDHPTLQVNLRSLPKGMMWKAIRPFVEAMGFKVRVRVEPSKLAPDLAAKAAPG